MIQDVVTDATVPIITVSNAVIANAKIVSANNALERSNMSEQNIKQLPVFLYDRETRKLGRLAAFLIPIMEFVDVEEIGFDWRGVGCYGLCQCGVCS